MTAAILTDWAGLGLFDLRKFGGLANGTHDDGPALQSAIDAAWSESGNGRCATPFFSPTCETWRIATPVSFTCGIASSTTPANTPRILGCGADSPIKIDLDATHDAITLNGGIEWFRGSLDDLYFIGADPTGATPSCRDVLRLTGSGPSSWNINNPYFCRVIAYQSLIHAGVGRYKITNFQDAGSVCYGADYRYMIYADQASYVGLDNPYSFWQDQFRAHSLSQGTALSLLYVVPLASSAFNGNNHRTRVVVKNAFTNPRILYPYFCAGDATHIAESFTLDNVQMSSGGNNLFYIDHCKNFEMVRSPIISSALCNMALSEVEHARIIRCPQSRDLGGTLKLSTDQYGGYTKYVEIEDTQFDSVVASNPATVVKTTMLGVV